MKRVFWLVSVCGSLGLGCSAAEPDGAGSSGAPATSGSAGTAGAGVSGNVGISGGGTGPAAAGGGQMTAGAAGSATSGGSGGSGNNNGGAGGGGAGSTNAGAGGGSACVPDPAGVFSIVGETVHDPKTCLDWMKTTKTGVNYEAAQTFCGDSMLGAFDDWRIPTASEFASTVTLCGKYPPEGPVDTKFFDQQGDGYWTTTSAGELNKVCAVGMLNAGDYYHYGTAGPQVVRCVRGTGTVKMIKDCTTAQGCKVW
jgi:Protein of unknown function (DUF1566)